MNKATRTYVALAFAITWTITIAGYVSYKAGAISVHALNLIYTAGALGPAMGALVCAGKFYGSGGIRKLLGTFRLKGISKRSFFIAVSPLLFLVIAWLTYPLYAGHWFSFAETQRQNDLSSALSYVGWILPFVTYALFEEFGWRAFLLPHLQQNNPALKATFILTVIWTVWHLPFFLWRFEFSGFITVGFFFSIFVGALVLTSLFNLGNGNIVPVILFHFCNNLSAALDKEYMVAVVSMCFVVLAVFLYRRFGYENLSDTERVKNFYSGHA